MTDSSFGARDQLERFGGNSAETLPAVLTAQGSLQRSLLNPFITSGDCEQVHQALERLSPGAYREAMAQLHREGLLTRYVGELDEEGRARFLSQAAQKGWVRVQHEASAGGPLEPPRPPALFVNEGRLPAEVRGAIHAHNLGTAREYCHSYQAYLDRYVRAVEQTRSGQELRALGPPSERASLSQPGALADHPDRAALQQDWLAAAEYPTTATAQRAIADKLSELRGEARPGFGWAGEAKVKTSAGVGRRTGLGRLVQVARERGVQGNLRPGQLSTAATEGHAYSVRVLGGKAELTETVDDRGQRTRELSLEHLSGAQVAVDDRGQVELKTSRVGPLRGVVQANPTEGQLSFGVELTPTLGSTEGEARSAIQLQGSSQKGAQHALDPRNEGVFATPPELARGVAWAQLRPEARDRHLRNGWTEQEWMEASAAWKRR